MNFIAHTDKFQELISDQIEMFFPSRAHLGGLNLSSVPRPEVFCNDAVLRKHGLCDPGCVAGRKSGMFLSVC